MTDNQTLEPTQSNDILGHSNSQTSLAGDTGRTVNIFNDLFLITLHNIHLVWNGTNGSRFELGSNHEPNLFWTEPRFDSRSGLRFDESRKCPNHCVRVWAKSVSNRTKPNFDNTRLHYTKIAIVVSFSRISLFLRCHFRTIFSSNNIWMELYLDSSWTIARSSWSTVESCKICNFELAIGFPTRFCKCSVSQIPSHAIVQPGSWFNSMHTPPSWSSFTLPHRDSFRSIALLLLSFSFTM